jgi:hypothetical protein
VTKDRTLSPQEENAQRTAQVMAYQAQGYTMRETARLIGCSESTVRRVIERVQKRIPAEDAKTWRQVQLLRLERLYEACQAVLTASHVVVSNGQVVRRRVFDDEGNPVWDKVYGPTGEVLLGPDGQPLVEYRTEPLEDHGAVLEAVAEMRKIEAEVTKLLGTQTPVKQAVELQHVDYTITGTDMSKVLGANLNQQ